MNYIYHYHVIVIIADREQYSDEFFSNAAPPVVGTIYKPLGLDIPIDDYVVTKVKLVLDELSNVPYVGKTVDLTIVEMEITPRH